MTIRDWLASKIPALRPVTVVTQKDIDKVAVSRAHLWLILWDATLGLFGADVAYITISARTAHAVVSVQYGDETGMWIELVPLWALALGAALETKWALPFISYSGHLQDALLADAARQIQGLQITAPTLAAKVISNG